MISWVDYRKGASRVAKDIAGTEVWEGPKWRNCWRWTETYYIVFIVVIIGIVWGYAGYYIIPMMV
jgi:hypothetical protein